MYFPENLAALLQAEDDVLLDLGELDVARQLLELLKLRVRLRQERLLVLLTAQRQKRSLLVAVGQALPRDLRLLLGQDFDAPLVLVELVALVLEVEDRPVPEGEDNILVQISLVKDRYFCWKKTEGWR